MDTDSEVGWRPRLLSLDHGGKCILSTLFILKEIMDRVSASRGVEPRMEPWQVFDLIGGVGPGGLVAIMLARLRMSIDECIEELVQLEAPPETYLSQWLRTLRLSHSDESALLQRVKNIFTETTLDSEIPWSDLNSCKCFIVVPGPQTTSTQVLLKTYAVSRDDQTIVRTGTWEAVQSSITSLLSPLSDGRTAGSFSDTHIAITNPVASVFDEAQRLWPRHANDAIMVSIGSGSAIPPPLSSGLRTLFDALKHISTKAEMLEQEFLRHQALFATPDHYFRFSVKSLDNGVSNIKNWKSLLTSTVLRYIGLVEVDYKLSLCAKSLAEAGVLSMVQAGRREERGAVSMGHQAFVLRNTVFAQPYGATPWPQYCEKPSQDAILEQPQYIRWLATYSSILWIFGDVGVGKSQLCHYLSRNHGKLTLGNSPLPPVVVSYFCPATKRRTHDAAAVFAGFLFQLLFHDPEWINLTNLDKAVNHFNAEILAGELSRIIESLSHDNSLMSGLTFILDGLDECDSASVATILNFITKLRDTPRLSFPVHFLLASRDMPELHQTLHQTGYPEIIYINLALDVKYGHEIGKFIRSELDKAEYSFLGNSKEKAKELIIGRCKGNLLWVHTVLDQLRRHKKRPANEAIGVISLTFAELYYKILCEIKSQYTGAVVEFLTWVLYARRPLTLSELSAAVAQPEQGTNVAGEDFIRDLARQCRGLCIIRDKTVFLSHSSVKEYLLRLEVSPEASIAFSRHWESRDVIEKKISDRCFEYIEYTDWLNPKQNVFDDEKTLRTLPLLKYSLCYWFHHARIASSLDLACLNTSASMYARESPKRKEWYVIYWRHRQLQGYDDTYFPLASPDSFSPLHLAAFLGFTELMSRLMESTWGDIDHPDIRGRTALAYASYFGHKPVIGFLRSRGASILRTDNEGITPLHFAVAGGHSDIAATLLRFGAEIDVADVRGNSPLLIAARTGWLDVAQILCTWDADINSGNRKYRRPLHEASQKGWYNIVQLLISRGANLNSRDGEGRTALHEAASIGNKRITRLLLDEGADSSVVDADDQTASITARINGHNELSRILADSEGIYSEEWETQSSSFLSMVLSPCEHIRSILEDPSVSNHVECTVQMELHWEVQKYIAKELSEGQDIRHVLTLSGVPNRAVAWPCREYMATIWPDTGLATLQLLYSILYMPRHTSSSCSRLAWAGLFNMDITLYPENINQDETEKAAITISGTKNYVIQVVQQIIWFASTFRIPSLGCLGYSLTRIQKRLIDNTTLLVVTFPQLTSQDPYPTPSEPGTCWHHLFRDSVLAYGFPIPERGEKYGLEVQYNVMVRLANQQSTLNVESATVVVGPTAIIYPTTLVQSSAKGLGYIQWHLVPRQANEDLTALVRNVPGIELPSTFHALRSFLGVWSQADVLVGTADFNKTNVPRSLAVSESSYITVKDNAITASITLGAGVPGSISPVTVSAAATIGLTAQINKSTMSSIDPSLDTSVDVLTAKDRVVVVYDTALKIGWLVPELCVVLWLAHALIRKRLRGMRGRKKEVERIMSAINGLHAERGDADTVFDLIVRRGSTLLWTNQGGQTQTSFNDIIEYIVKCLKARRDATLEARLRPRLTLPSNKLFGWDAFEIVNESGTYTPSFRKEVEWSSGIIQMLRTKAKGKVAWYELSKNEKFLVLFSQNTGELIRPATGTETCILWGRAPDREKYLVASIPSLLLMVGDEEGSRLRLTDGVGWEPLPPPFYGCLGTKRSKKCNWTQELVRNPRQSFCLESVILQAGMGAVIFGDRSAFQPNFLVKHCRPQVIGSSDR